ncbi:MAG: hypothetical protein HS117_26830 [Verrucomicrobiaceae bacterium]|nr:hypothetical protein [Verrucomicrobiaceae bacterium]
MNLEKTVQDMLKAATKAAKGQWKAMSDYAETEFRRLSAAAIQLEASFALDMVTAAAQGNARKRAKLEKTARERAQLAFENIELAAAAVVDMSKADLKLAAQDAVNAALKVLATAINTSLGVPLL